MASVVVYFLCALTSGACFLLLWRSWRDSRARLLFWSSLCFAGMTLTNVLLIFDKIVFPTEVDLRLARLVVALVAVLLLVFGLVWDEE